MKNTLFLLAVVLSSVMLPHLVQAKVDTADLVLYLPFDEMSGGEAFDASGNGNDGELLEGAEWVDGHIGGGVRLSEIPDVVEVADSPSLDIVESLTLAIWANIEGLPDGSCALFMKPTTYMMHTTTGGVGVKMDPLVFIGGNYGTWPTPVTVSAPMGEWHHYTATYDGTEYALYIDGELVDSYERVPGGPIDQDDSPLTVGRDNRDCCAQRNSPCVIDEATVWSRALSQTEIAEVMQGGFAAVEPGNKLATYWGAIRSQ